MATPADHDLDAADTVAAHGGADGAGHPTVTPEATAAAAEHYDSRGHTARADDVVVAVHEDAGSDADRDGSGASAAMHAESADTPPIPALGTTTTDSSSGAGSRSVDASATTVDDATTVAAAAAAPTGAGTSVAVVVPTSSSGGSVVDDPSADTAQQQHDAATDDASIASSVTETGAEAKPVDPEAELQADVERRLAEGRAAAAAAEHRAREEASAARRTARRLATLLSLSAYAEFALQTALAIALMAASAAHVPLGLVLIGLVLLQLVAALALTSRHRAAPEGTLHGLSNSAAMALAIGRRRLDGYGYEAMPAHVFVFFIVGADTGRPAVFGGSRADPALLTFALSVYIVGIASLSFAQYQYRCSDGAWELNELRYWYDKGWVLGSTVMEVAVRLSSVGAAFVAAPVDAVICLAVDAGVKAIVVSLNRPHPERTSALLWAAGNVWFDFVTATGARCDARGRADVLRRLELSNAPIITALLVISTTGPSGRGLNDDYDRTGTPPDCAEMQARGVDYDWPHTPCMDASLILWALGGFVFYIVVFVPIMLQRAGAIFFYVKGVQIFIKSKHPGAYVQFPENEAAAAAARG